MIYLLDTNTVSDMLKEHTLVLRRIAEHIVANDELGLSRPVYYEIQRGLLWNNSTNKQIIFNQRVASLFRWVELEPIDWEQAARFWANARRVGHQLADADLLLAALAYRLHVTLVSSDADYDVLPISRENWRDTN